MTDQGALASSSSPSRSSAGAVVVADSAADARFQAELHLLRVKYAKNGGDLVLATSLLVRAIICFCCYCCSSPASGLRAARSKWAA